jgi:hypothetical protein
MYLNNVPKNVQRLDIHCQPDEKNIADFYLYQCINCGLVQASASLESTYYDDYLMSTTFSSQLNQYLDTLVDEFIIKYNLQTARVLDVGAGDGAFMLPFHRRGIPAVGIEPSERSRIEAVKKGLVVYPGYVTADTVVPGGPYTAFVSRQVLEHVDDISGFLSGLIKNLTPGAVGIIEVPRLEKSLEDQRFYDFFPDHVNYFSLDTLSTTLSLHGFQVLELRSTMYDEYNVAIVKKRTVEKFSKIEHQRVNLVQQLQSLLIDCRRQQQITAIWGAGAKGISIMSLIDSSCLDLVVDSDPNKTGRHVPGNQKLIQLPEQLITQQVNVTIITAVAYQSTILQKLKQMNYTGKIYVIEANGLKEYSCSTY